MHQLDHVQLLGRQPGLAQQLDDAKQPAHRRADLMAHHREKLRLRAGGSVRLVARGAQYLLGLLVLCDVTKKPDAAEMLPGMGVQLHGAAINEPPVNGFDFILTGLVGMSNEIPHPCRELPRLLHQGERRRQGGADIFRRQQCLWQLPYLGKPVVERDDVLVDIKRQYAVGRRLHLRHEQNVEKLQRVLGSLALGYVGEGLQGATVRQRQAADLDDPAVRPVVLMGTAAFAHSAGPREAVEPGDEIAVVRAELAAPPKQPYHVAPVRPVGSRVFRQVEQLAHPAVDHLNHVVGVAHDDALDHVLQGDIEQARLCRVPALAVAQRLARPRQPRLMANHEHRQGQQERRHHGCDSDIGSLIGVVARHDLILAHADGNDEREAADLPVGKDALHAVHPARHREMAGPLPWEGGKHRATGDGLADRRLAAGGAGADDAVQSDQQRRTLAAQVDGCVEVGQVAGIQGNDDHAVERAVRGG